MKTILNIGPTLLILMTGVAGCYSGGALSRTRRWVGPDSFVITDTIKVPMRIAFNSVSKHTSDSIVTIEGIVRDSTTNKALGGVLVLDRFRHIKARMLATATNYLGAFKLNGVGISDSLSFRYIGYATKDIFVGDVVNLGRRIW